MPAYTWPPKATISIKELSVIIGVGCDALRTAVKDGKIPTLRIGRRFLVPVRKMRELLGDTGPQAYEWGAKPLLKVPEVCALLGIGAGLVRDAIAREQIPSQKAGRHIYVPAAKLRIMIEGHQPSFSGNRADSVA